MRLLLTATVCAAGALHAQSDLIYYKFDSAAGQTILNYAVDRTPATAMGAGPSYGESQGLAPGGSFDSPASLRGSTPCTHAKNTVGTGFTGAISGSMTIALTMKNRSANTPSLLNGLLGRPDFDLSSGGRAGSGLQLRGWGGPDLTFTPHIAICSMAGWNHFAVVLDHTRGQVTWYLNGAVAQTEKLSQAVAIQPSATALMIGRDWQTSGGSYYDLDEIRVSSRAATSAEVSAWSKGSTPATSVFGDDVNRSPDVGLSAVGGSPHFGNTQFGLRVDGAPGAFALAIGTRRFASPVDAAGLIGAAGFLHIAADLVVLGHIDGTGVARVAAPIPATGLGVLEVYTQAVASDLGKRLTMTHALAHSVGARSDDR